ncbi:MAG: ABC transporter permease subunit [Armatimonadetes bacterium]|nr:ABC transporter permease subunit [Armatimonadota bacterium]
MRKIWVVAKMSLLENSRKQVFHVLCLVMLALIASSMLLSIFTEGVRLKILKDICMTSILFGGSALAIALGSMGIPNDVESRTIYPIFARPISRSQYITGKFLGTMLTVFLGVLAMTIVFAALIASFNGGFDPYLLLAVAFTLLEVCIVAAIATTISVFASPAVTAAFTFMIYICGTIKIGYFGGMIERTADGISKSLFGVIYHILPNLECFNLKASLVHHDPVPASYLAQVAVYGLCYSAFVLFIGMVKFGRREV